MLLATGAKVHSGKSPVLDDLKLWNSYVGEEHVVNAFPPAPAIRAVSMTGSPSSAANAASMQL